MAVRFHRHLSPLHRHRRNPSSGRLVFSRQLSLTLRVGEKKSQLESRCISLADKLSTLADTQNLAATTFRSFGLFSLNLLSSLSCYLSRSRDRHRKSREQLVFNRSQRWIKSGPKECVIDQKNGMDRETKANAAHRNRLPSLSPL